MKFALAAGLLTGSLPVASANAVDATLEDAQNFFLRSNVNGVIQGNSLPNIKHCNPTSDDPNVGAMSCGQGHFCLPKEDSMLGGICESKENILNLVPKFRQRGALKNGRGGWRKSLRLECDPMAEPDVGILICDSGETCVPSTFSSMGGLCQSSTSGRDLQASTVYLCDPASQSYSYCDCSGVDNATGTGVVTCLPYGEDYCLTNLYPGGVCSGVCGTVKSTYPYENFINTGYTVCRESTTPYSQVACVESSYADGTCTVNLDGETCTSCEIIPNGNFTAISFDCSNAGGNVGISYYSFDLLPVVQACSSGTASGNSTAVACDICNGPLANPDAVASVLQYTFTCSEFQSKLNTTTTCSLAAPLLAPTCCVASGNETTSEPAGSMSPAPSPSLGEAATPEPGPSDGGDGGDGGDSGGDGGAMPPSGGSTVFTKSTWLVTLGLAVAWTFGQAN